MKNELKNKQKRHCRSQTSQFTTNKEIPPQVRNEEEEEQKVGVIRFYNEDIDYHLIIKKKIRSWLLSVIEQEQKKIGEISCILCSENHLLRLNCQYLSASYHTDVITFDYTKNGLISGDIFISIKRVKENAKLYKQAFSQELLRVILHGVLHLCGYKDKKDDEIALMREKEDIYLQKFDAKI